MTKYCVLSQMKVTSMAEMKALFAHNARKYTPKNCNPEESYLNEYMLSTESYVELFNRLIKTYGVKPRSNSVLALEYVSKFTPGAQIDLEKWKKKNRNFFEDTFGKENVISMIVHYDEHTPHIHTVVIPLDKKIKQRKDGREEEHWSLNAKKYTGGKAAMCALQSSYASYMQEFGLKKGTTVKAGKAGHEDIKKFYKDISYAANFRLPDSVPEESVGEYIRRVTPLIQEESMNYQRMIRKWRKELHEAEVMLEEQKPLAQWAGKLEDKGLLLRLMELSEEEIRELLNSQSLTLVRRKAAI